VSFLQIAAKFGLTGREASSGPGNTGGGLDANIKTDPKMLLIVVYAIVSSF
jgi:hypothetical protein